MFPYYYFHEKATVTIQQGDSDSENIICIDSKFNQSVDTSVVESYNGFVIYLTSLS